jgi:hypothetical protein
MKKLIVLACCMSILTCAGVAAAGNVPVFTFEDLYPGYEAQDIPIPAPYHGYTFNAAALGITKNHLPGTGYEYGTMGRVSMYTGYANSISIQGAVWDLKGSYITAAWDATETVTVEGWLAGVLKYTQDIVTHNDKAYWFNFNFTDIDTVWFKPHGEHLDIDNINGDHCAVPVPPTVWLLGSSLLGLVGFRKKFRR